MRKHYIYIIPMIIAMIGCEQNIVGPPGRDGLDGLDGLDGEEAFVFEYEFDFTFPEYSVLLDLPSDFTMLDSDVMLAYLLWDVAEDGTEVWRALPQSLYFQDGILEYNYDFTKFDASIFLDGTVNLDGLGADLTDGWIARLVVVPGQFSGRTVIDYNDYNQVKELYKLPSSKLVSKDYPKRPQ